MPPQVPAPQRSKKYTMGGRSIKILFACKYFLFFNPCRCLTPAHTKHLLFLTILHFSSIDFLISVHFRFSSGGNNISVHSHCCHSVWVQFEKFITLAFNTAQLCFFPAEDKFEKFCSLRFGPHYGTAPVGSHDYLCAHKGNRRMSRPLIQDSSVSVLFRRYKGNLT